MAANSPPRRLDRYRRKRSAERTPEPFGGEGPQTASGAATSGPTSRRPLRFCVQKHDATRLHYDFRLEWNGVLLSWAVPKGPSLDPREKRLAVHVEDHPVEYADFEGLIPDGNYGAGPVIVWDRGWWQPHGDVDEALARGALGFDLHGHRLRGAFSLVRTQSRKGARRTARPDGEPGEGTEWLLVKKGDAHAKAGHGSEAAPLATESILTGRRVDELVALATAHTTRAATVAEEARRLGAPTHALTVDEVDLMLAEQGGRPFSRAGWLFELKYDGYRVLGGKEPGDVVGAGRVKLRYRRGSDAAALYPEVASAVAALDATRLVLDGELVVEDDLGRPSFQRLQQRSQLSRPLDIERLSLTLPASLHCFDLLAVEDVDLRPLPLAARKRLLQRLLLGDGATSGASLRGPLRYVDHIEEAGAALHEEVGRLGLEGTMAKRMDAPYRGGRRPEWLKLPIAKRGDFVVVGWSEPSSGGRTGFGALHLAAHRASLDGGPPALTYCGRVGTGFSEKQLRDLRALLEPDARKEPPCVGHLPTGKGHRWVEPRLVVEVRYKEITDDGHLRLPVLERVRDDKPLADCTLPALAAGAPRGDETASAGRDSDGSDGDASEGSDEEEAVLPRIEQAPPTSRTIAFSNLGKLFWPATTVGDEPRGPFTKGDLVDYYRAVAPWLLPYLRDRPVVLTRFPDGIAGKSFFQKDAPAFVPPWLRTQRMWSEHAQREIDHFVVDDSDALLYLANLATIPLHVWASRVSQLARPDWCIVDLDPKSAPFSHVVDIALALRALCEDIGLPSFVKTSGQKGLHVLVPTGGALSFEEVKVLGELLARVVEGERPAIATTLRNVESRGGRVYVDFLQNGHGKLLAAMFCARPVPAASVSTTLDWSEVGPRLDPTAFHLKSVPARLERRGDPMAPLLTLRPDIPAALARLGERLARGRPPAATPIAKPTAKARKR